MWRCSHLISCCDLVICPKLIDNSKVRTRIKMLFGINPGCICRSGWWFNMCQLYKTAESCICSCLVVPDLVVWRYTLTKYPVGHFPEEEVLVWMVQSISKGLVTSRVAVTPVSVGHALLCHCQGQILWGHGNSPSWNGHTTIWSSWVPQIASQGQYSTPYR